MEPDGSDIIRLSYHETNEWQPTVSHSGKIAYKKAKSLIRSGLSKTYKKKITVL